MLFNRSNASKDSEYEATGGYVSIGFYYISLRLQPFSHIDTPSSHSRAIFRRLLYYQWKKKISWYPILCGIDFVLPPAIHKPTNLAFSLRLYPGKIWIFYLAVISWFVSLVEQQKKIGSKETEAWNVDTEGGEDSTVVREMQMKQSCDNIDEVQQHNGMVCAGFGNEISNLRDKWTLTCTMELANILLFSPYFFQTVC